MAVKRNIVLFEEAKEWGKEDSSDVESDLRIAMLRLYSKKRVPGPSCYKL